MITIKEKGEIVGNISISKAEPEKINIKILNDATILKRKGEEKKTYTSEIKLDDNKLPIKKGEVSGTLRIKDDNTVIKKISLISDSDMQKKSFFKLWQNTFKSMLTGNLID